MIVPLVGQHLVTDFKKCGLYLKSKSSLPQLFRKLLDNCCLEPSCRAGEHQKTAKFYCDIRYCVKNLNTLIYLIYIR